MPDLEQKQQNEFIIEKIKERPVNKKKLIRRTLITASMAVIFGLIACFTFLVLEPVISNWLYPEEEPQIVVIPEDQEEMSPEEMLAENLPTESPQPAQKPEEVNLEEEQIQEILDKVTLNMDNYVQLYSALYDFIYQTEDSSGRVGISQYVVTIRGITSNIDWFNNVQERDSQVSGVIIADNGKEYLILVDYTPLQGADELVLELSDGCYQIEAQLKGLDPSTNLAVLAVNKYNIPVEWMEVGGLAVAPMGSSNTHKLVGTPVVAVGSPMGTSGSIGYGIITSSTTFSTVDRNYKLILTDIAGSRKANGALFNLQGQLIGIVTGNKAGTDMENMISALGITELKKVVEKMSNGTKLAYLGISGVDVPGSVHDQTGIPYGAYVKKVNQNSPAMLAGIQQGDVITAIDSKAITTFSDYTNQLMQLTPGQTVELKVMRQAQTEYKEMSFSIELGEITD